MVTNMHGRLGSAMVTWSSNGREVAWKSGWALGAACVLPDGSGIATIPAMDAPGTAEITVVNGDGTRRLGIGSPLVMDGDYSYYTLSAVGKLLYVVLASRGGDIGLMVDPDTGRIVRQDTAR